MLQQTEIVELVEELNRRQDNKSFVYALAVGFLALTIMFFGITMLYSSTFSTNGEVYFKAQANWVIISIFAMIAVIFIGYKRIAQWTPWLLVLLASLLIWALCSKTIKGANRWITIPIINMNFQPSELAKVVLPLYGAHFIAENLRLMPQLRVLSIVKNFKLAKQFLLPAGIIGGILLLVFAGHDLGTTVLLASAMISLAFCGGIPKRILACCVVLAMVGVTVFLLNDPERISRITSIGQMDSEEVRQGDGYQLWNSLLALGSGGWNGIGFMESRMKNRYLPDHHTDFILAVVGEEIGFLGLLGVILAYLCFGFFGMKIALNSRSRFGMLLAQTLTVIIVLQAGINIGVISGGLPTKGLTAPLISYGGSNLLINMIMVGLIISVGLENVPGLTDKWPLRKKEEQ